MEQLVHGADDQDGSEGEKPCIPLTDCVERKSGADADERGGHAVRLHGSGGLGFVAGQHFGGNTLATAYVIGDEPVDDSGREFFRPLGDGLVSHTESFGGGMGGASKEFDGFGFQHSPIMNHSSALCATIVLGAPLSFGEMDEYKDRIDAALTHAETTEGALAKQLGVSPQAVRKIVLGTSSAFTAYNNAKAAQFLGVDAEWLATGEGDMVTGRVWPFPRVTLMQIQQLTPDHLKDVQNLTLSLLQSQLPPIVAAPSPTENVKPGQTKPRTRATYPSKRKASAGIQSEGQPPRKTRRS